MEIQIKDLVDSIRKDGIDAARAEADAILADAHAKAAAILAEANEQAKAVREAAEQDARRFAENAAVTAEHAKRDAILAFRDSVKNEFEKLLRADTAKAVTGEVLAKLILAALAGEDPAAYAAEVAQATEGLQGELAQAIREGLEIRVNPRVRAGFRLAAKDGSGYFDCSDEELEAMLAPYFPDLV